MTRQEKDAEWGHWRAPPKIGRDVAKVFTSLAWKRAGTPIRGRRLRMLGMLEDMVHDARTIAKALGDDSDLIYSAPRIRPDEAPPERTTIDSVTWWLRPDLVYAHFARAGAERATSATSSARFAAPMRV